MSNISFFTAKTVITPANQNITKNQQDFAMNRAKELVKVNMDHVAQVTGLSRDAIRSTLKDFLHKAINLAKISEVRINFKCGILTIKSDSLTWTG